MRIGEIYYFGIKFKKKKKTVILHYVLNKIKIFWLKKRLNCNITNDRSLFLLLQILLANKH